MSKIQRPIRWDTTRKRAGKRITPRDQDVILNAYERAMRRGENRDEILSKLAERYDRSERQIERYIQQAKAKKVRVGKQQEEQVGQVSVVDDRPQALLVHYEAIREAIRLWIEKLRPASDEELADLWKGKLDAWGVIAEVTDGHGFGQPAMGSHPLYDSLRCHLVPPVVSQDLWSKVSEMVERGLGFLSGAASTCSELTRVAQERSGFGITGNTWQDEPVTGLTQDYIQTLYDYALGISNFRGWAHSFWAVTWPNTGGLVITWPNEGVRLRSGTGYDPSIRETYWVLAGDTWLLPRHMGERIAYGDATLNSPCRVAFLLCFGTRVIAVVLLPEQLTLCRDVHKTMMKDCTTWQRAITLRRARAGLDSVSQEVIAALEYARRQTSFAGKCSSCP